MNKSARLKRSLVTTAMALGTLCAGAWRAEADLFRQISFRISRNSPPSPSQNWSTLGVFPILPRALFGFRTRVPVQPLSSRSRPAMTSRK